MPLQQLRALQEERLLKQVPFVYENVPFYRNKMDEAGVKPGDIKTLDDIQKLPFLTKDDLKDQYPYGLLAVPLSECGSPVDLRHHGKTRCGLLHTG